MSTKSITKRLLTISCVSMLMGVTAQAQFNFNGTNNSTAVALRDPARQASTSVDAAIYNPAGTAFLEDGFHVSLNGLYSYQSLCSYGIQDNKAVDMHHERIMNITPSIQLVWKKGDLSLSASLADEGDMGKFTCAEGSIPYSAYFQGLSMVYGLDEIINELNMDWLLSKALLSLADYNETLDIALEDEYRLGTSKFAHTIHNQTARLGASYAINANLSVYAGAKLSYLTRATSMTPQIQMYRASTFQNWEAYSYFNSKAELLGQGTDAFEPNTELAEIFKNMANNVADVSLDAFTTNHSAMGVTPVVGVDYRLGRVNIGAKYEFQTMIDNKDWTGFKLPSNFSLGANWAILDNLNVALGGRAFFRTNDNYGLHGDIEPNKMSGTVAASISYSPLKKLLLSIGQSYESYSGYWFLPLSEDLEIPNLYRLSTSFGCAYDITERLQLNIGSRIGYTPTHIATNMEFNIFDNGEYVNALKYPINYYTNIKYNVALGVNYRF